MNRADFIDIIKRAILELGLVPLFALDLEENNNFDAFYTNIRTPIRSSILIVIDLSAPKVSLCDKCNTTCFYYTENCRAYL